MKIHEFQAKELLSDYNVPIQRGHVVYSSNDIEKTIEKVQNEFNSDAVSYTHLTLPTSDLV